MQAKRISDEDIVRRLNEHPELRERVAALLLVVRDEAGDLKRADAAEQRQTQELRRMGQDAMQACVGAASVAQSRSKVRTATVSKNA